MANLRMIYAPAFPGTGTKASDLLILLYSYIRMYSAGFKHMHQSGTTEQNPNDFTHIW